MWDIGVEDVLNAARSVVYEPWFGAELHPASDSQCQLNMLLLTSSESE